MSGTPEPDAAPTVGPNPAGVSGADRPIGRGTTRRGELLAAQKQRYGGIKWGSAFFGWLTANGFAVILIALLSAAGVALGLAQNVDTADEAAQQAETLGIGGGIAILVVLFLAYLAGGYVAGRMARFDGVKNGIGVVIWTIIMAVVLGVLGAVLGNQFDLTQRLRLNIDRQTLTTAGVISLAVTLIVMLAGAILGGKLGTGYHRKIDRAAGVT